MDSVTFINWYIAWVSTRATTFYRKKKTSKLEWLSPEKFVVETKYAFKVNHLNFVGDFRADICFSWRFSTKLETSLGELSVSVEWNWVLVIVAGSSHAVIEFPWQFSHFSFSVKDWTLGLTLRFSSPLHPPFDVLKISHTGLFCCTRR